MTSILEKGELTVGLKYAVFALFSFVVGFSELYVMLILKNTIYVLPDEIKRSAKLLTDYYKVNRIDETYIPPQLLRVIDEKDFSLKYIKTGGEAITNVNFDRVTLINCYGFHTFPSRSHSKRRTAALHKPTSADFTVQTFDSVVASYLQRVLNSFFNHLCNRLQASSSSCAKIALSTFPTFHVL